MRKVMFAFAVFVAVVGGLGFGLATLAHADYKLSLGLGKSVDNIVFAGARWNF